MMNVNYKLTEIITKIPIVKDPKTSNIEGNLRIPENSKGIVIFAHGSGSGRYSPRNQYVAKVLNDDGLATLLVDLLTEEEEKIDILTKEYRFDIELLAHRLLAVTEWLTKQDNTRNMILGYFGASTGAAAALIAADKKPENVSAIVSRGGRVDLSYKHTSLKSINCPTLFIVGEKDNQVIELNQQVLDRYLVNVLKKKIIVISGASHLFEETGKIEEVAKKASGWFRCYFQIKEHETNSQKEK
jgi:putative phosphoribosyl transferase